MLDDYEYYRNKLKKVTVYVPSSTTSYTSRQVTMAANAVMNLRFNTAVSNEQYADYLGKMLARDPAFYDAVMDKMERSLADAMMKRFLEDYHARR